MKLRSGLLGLTLTSVVALASANAADMYPAPAGGGYKDTPYVGVNWSGLYVGVNGGGAWNATHSDDLVDPTGGFGGGQIGYNWQGAWHPNLVLGIEADFQGGDISDSKSVCAGGACASAKSELEWFGTVRGRLGYAFDRALIYGTGGFAYGSVKNSASINIPGLISASGSRSETQTGWVAGGGIEYKLAPSWSAKAEYQFLSLDASSPEFARLGFADGGNSEVHTFRIGVNYFLGRGYEPLK
jgi:outer membrane immunogenic protein